MSARKKQLLPSRAEPVVFGIILTGLMSALISGVAAFASIRSLDGLTDAWLRAWLSSWPVAFIAVLFVRPLAQNLTDRIVAQPGSQNCSNSPDG